LPRLCQQFSMPIGLVWIDQHALFHQRECGRSRQRFFQTFDTHRVGDGR
jgi:hypothetical protein